MLTKDQILAAHDIVTRKVAVPEWGGDVFVRMMSSRDRDRFEADIAQNRTDMTNFRARLCARCLCDDAGKTLFTEAEADALGEKSAAALNRVFVAASALNHFTDAEVAQLEKN